MLQSWFRKPPEKAFARDIYDQLVRQARSPDLYEHAGIPDTIEGRFEAIILHASLVFHRLRALGERADVLRQSVFDTMFDDFDAAMRELGVGDSGVGKKIRFMAEGFYGRAQVYVDAIQGEDAAALKEALARNVLGGDTPAAEAAPLALYVKRYSEFLENQDDEALLTGELAAMPTQL